VTIWGIVDSAREVLTPVIDHFREIILKFPELRGGVET